MHVPLWMNAHEMLLYQHHHQQWWRQWRLALSDAYRGVSIVSSGGDDVFSRKTECFKQHQRVVVWCSASCVTELQLVLHVWRSVDQGEVELRFCVDCNHSIQWLEHCQAQTFQRQRNLVNTSHTNTQTYRVTQKRKFTTELSTTRINLPMRQGFFVKFE